jgi:hypothetical protein
MEKRWMGTGIGWALGGPWWGLAGYLLGDRFDGSQSTAVRQRKLLLADLMGFSAQLLQTTGQTGAAPVEQTLQFWGQKLALSPGEVPVIAALLQDLLGQALTMDSLMASSQRCIKAAHCARIWQGLAELVAALHLPRERAAPWLMQMAQHWELLALESPGPAGIDADAEPCSPEHLAACYQVLGIPLKATWDQVKAAYHQQAKKVHPDRLPQDAAPLARGELHQQMTRLNAAYQVLKRWFGAG